LIVYGGGLSVKYIRLEIPYDAMHFNVAFSSLKTPILQFVEHMKQDATRKRRAIALIINFFTILNNK
jgi:hypothetical protein